MHVARTGSGRIPAAIAVVATLAACSPRPDQGQSPVVDGLKFDYGLVAEPARRAPPASHPDPSMHGPPHTGDGTITVDHGPIPEVSWLAMTMDFKAAPELVQSVKAGDKVALT